MRERKASFMLTYEANQTEDSRERFFYYVTQNAMPQGKKVAIGFESYGFTLVASLRQ